jgi:CubicO group peptidase (beta-lactamase class C family)
MMAKIAKGMVALFCLLLVQAACESSDLKNSSIPGQNEDMLSVGIDSIIDSATEDYGPGGAVCVTYRGRVIHRKGYGFADMERKIPFSPETPCYLASVSKQFTCMAIMILKEQGLISYSDSLPEFFEDIPEQWNGITVHHLMTHTSGLPRFFSLGWDTENITNEKVFERLKDYEELEFAPGTGYSYCNSGYIFLALIVEKVTGTPFHLFMRDNVFQPLKMQQTLVYDKSRPVINGCAVGYALEENALEIHDYNLLTMGAGGIYSTVDDLSRWDKGLSEHTLVKKETLQEAFSLHFERSEGEYYGYGVVISEYERKKRIWHNGELSGFRTHFTRIPEAELSIAVLTNGGWIKAHEIADSILELLILP